MKRFRWNDEKNTQLQKERGVSFEEVVEALEADGLLDTLKHHNPERYPRQQLFVVSLHDYAYVVPYVEENDTYFLKTIYPSSNMTRRYLRQGEE